MAWASEAAWLTAHNKPAREVRRAGQLLERIESAQGARSNLRGRLARQTAGLSGCSASALLDGMGCLYMRRWNGSTGSTIADCSSRSGTCHRQNPNRRSIANWKSRSWRPDSNKRVSGIPGVIHFLHARMFCDDSVSAKIGHSCRHGRPPHDILVFIVKKDNPKELYDLMAKQTDGR